MTKDEIAELVSEENPEALLAEGFEEAFVGVARRCGQPTLAVYSIQKAIRLLMRRDGMHFDEAVEYFEFNTLGAWLGPHTPIWIEELEDA